MGFAIARALAAEGCDLILIARRRASLERVGRELKAPTRRVLCIACDVRHPKQVKALATAVRKNFGRVDILVNNAGIAHANARVQDLPVAVWNEVIETNLTGTFLITQALLPLMKRGAAIVNNLSIAATRV